MIAAHHGSCALCDEPILPGQRIATVRGAWVHARCAQARWGE